MEQYVLWINLFSLLIFLTLYKNKKFITSKLNLVDRPDKNIKKHKKETSLIGGLLIFSCLLYLIIVDRSFNINSNFIFKIIIILIPIFFIGMLDDIYNINPNTRLLTLSFLMLFFLYSNQEFLLKEIYFDDFKKIYLLNNFSSFFYTTLCMLLLINAFNMSDGINGLAHSISIIWIGILIVLFNLNITFYFITLIIFLSFILNYKGKYFLGNSGSLLLSSFIGLTTIYLYNTGINSKDAQSVEKIILIFLIPGLDMLRLFIFRISKNKNPFSGDRNHFHHYLIKNMDLAKTIFIYLLLMLWPIIFINFYKIKYLFIFALQSMIFFFLVSYFKNKKKLKN